MLVLHPPMHETFVSQMLHFAAVSLFLKKSEVKPLTADAAIHVQLILTLPVGAFTLVIRGFFFRSVDWVSKQGIKT